VNEAVLETFSYGLSLSRFTWPASPDCVKENVYIGERQNLPSAMEGVVAELKHNLVSIVDLNELAIEKITQIPSMQTDIFKRVAGSGFRFLTRC
jgi:hypothetical protein